MAFSNERYLSSHAMDMILHASASLRASYASADFFRERARNASARVFADSEGVIAILRIVVAAYDLERFEVLMHRFY
jgi:hypothetical protein